MSLRCPVHGAVEVTASCEVDGLPIEVEPVLRCPMPIRRSIAGEVEVGKCGEPLVEVESRGG
jgi:hypothetical protein